MDTNSSYQQQPSCIRCSSSNVIKFGYDRKGNNRYKCRDCNKHFGTHPRKVPKPKRIPRADQYLIAMEIVDEGKNYFQVAAELGISVDKILKWVERYYRMFIYTS